MKITRPHLELHAPVAGIDLSRAFWDQRPRKLSEGFWARTTPVGVNFRGFDPVTDRARGGVRSGLSKFVDTPVVEGWIIQHLDTIAHVEDAVQLSQSGRVVTLVATAQGNVYRFRKGDTDWTTPTNNTGDDPPLAYNGLHYSTTLGGKMYFADMNNWVLYDPHTDTVERWAASAGVLPVDDENNTPRLICTYRGRIVLGGLPNIPQALYFSAVDDATNHEYFTAQDEFSPTQAVAFTTGREGEVGDIVTGLCSWSDDILIIFCQSSIYLLKGDPAEGGRRDLVTTSLGAIWGIPWAMDPQGNVYFMGSDTGVYVFNPSTGQQPQRISQPVEQLFKGTDTGDSVIRLQWNHTFQELEIYITPADEPTAARHKTYEARLGSWWETVLADDDMNPLCCCTFDGNDPDDRVALIGSWDGYVRAWDHNATTDDGEKIAWEVAVGPFLTPDLLDIEIRTLQAVIGAESEPVTMTLHSAKTAEAALEADAGFTREWTATTRNQGRNLSTGMRRAGHAHYLMFSGDHAPASFESMRLEFYTRGDAFSSRGRGK